MIHSFWDIQNPAVGKSDPWPIHSLLTSTKNSGVIPWLLSLMVPIYSTSLQIVRFLMWQNPFRFSDWNLDTVIVVTIPYHIITKILKFQINTQSFFPHSFPESLSIFSQVFLTSLFLWAHFRNSQQFPLTWIHNGFQEGKSVVCSGDTRLTWSFSKSCFFSLIKITFLCAYLVAEFKEGGNM